MSKLKILKSLLWTAITFIISFVLSNSLTNTEKESIVKEALETDKGREILVKALIQTKE